MRIPNLIDDVKIEYKDTKQINQFTDEKTIKLSYKELSKDISFSVPRIQDDSSFMYEGNDYQPLPCLAKPLIIVDKSSHSITIKNIVTDFTKNTNLDAVFKVSRRGNVYSILCGKIVFGHLNSIDRQKIVLSDNDRSELNNFLGLDIKTNYLTSKDITKIEDILLDKWDKVEDTNIKELSNMRLCEFSDMLDSVISAKLPFLCYRFRETGKISEEYLNRICQKYINESSQCQLSLEHTDIGASALREKVLLPFSSFDNELAADPHPSWIGYIDSLNTPQSEKSGATVALCDGVTIENGKLCKNKEYNDPRSGLMRKTVIFPTMLKISRHVMCSAIHKQCCDLGINNEDMRVVGKDTEHYPQPCGRYANVALMDWNLMTHEDACVVSESFADKLKTTKMYHYRYADSSDDYMIAFQEGDEIRPRQAIGVKSDGSSMITDAPRRSKIVAISKYKEKIENNEVNIIDVSLECSYPCGVGDKLSNLHSCKSIISAVLPNTQMPTMANGEAVDMIISPISIGRRGTVSLHMEGMLNTLSSAKGENITVNPYNPPKFQNVADELSKAGIPDDCMFPLRDGKDGSSFKYMTCILPLFIMRLHHHAVDKISYNNKLNHDYRGMTLRGAGCVKYGREELEILYSYGSDNIIKECVSHVDKCSSKPLLKSLLKTSGYKLC